MKHSAGPRDAKWHLVLDFGVSGGQQGVVGTVAHRHAWRAPAAAQWGCANGGQASSGSPLLLKKKEKLKI